MDYYIFNTIEKADAGNILLLNILKSNNPENVIDGVLYGSNSGIINKNIEINLYANIGTRETDGKYTIPKGEELLSPGDYDSIEAYASNWDTVEDE